MGRTQLVILLCGALFTLDLATTEASMKSIGKPLDPKTLADELVRIGEVAIAKRDDAALDRYFTKDFVFHGPAGDATLADLKTLWEAMRQAFAGFAVRRERIMVDGHFVAARTRMSGIFEHEFTHSPIGLVRPTGKSVSLVIHNFFRYDDQGRLAEEWAQFDNLGFLKQLGVGSSWEAMQEGKAVIPEPADDWPDGYVESFSGVPDDLSRPPQGKVDKRPVLK